MWGPVVSYEGLWVTDVGTEAPEELVEPDLNLGLWGWLRLYPLLTSSCVQPALCKCFKEKLRCSVLQPQQGLSSPPGVKAKYEGWLLSPRQPSCPQLYVTPPLCPFPLHSTKKAGRQRSWSQVA